MKDEYKLLDVNGEVVTVSTTELYTVFVAHPDFRLFGMPYNAILKFKKMYDMANGPLPITVDRIEMVFHRPEELPLAKPYNRNPRTHRAPDQYPQERRNTDKKFMPRDLTESEKEQADRNIIEAVERAVSRSETNIHKRELTESEKEDVREQFIADMGIRLAEDEVISFAGMEIKEDASMEKDTFRISRDTFRPRGQRLQDPTMFASSKSLDGKNIKKKKVPIKLTVTINHDEFDKTVMEKVVAAIDETLREPNVLMFTRSLESAKVAERIIKKNTLYSAMRVARKDMEMLVENNEKLYADKDIHPLMKIGRIGSSLAAFSDIARRIGTISAEIKKLDSD